LARAVLRLVGLEEDARGGPERAAEGDQPACLREVNLTVATVEVVPVGCGG
jgi:hypothetical protein